MQVEELLSILNDCPNDECRRRVLLIDVMIRRQQVAARNAMVLAVWLGLCIVFFIFASCKLRRLRRNTLRIPPAEGFLPRNTRHIAPADGETVDQTAKLLDL